jgi:hypothetical protein
MISINNFTFTLKNGSITEGLNVGEIKKRKKPKQKNDINFKL